MFTHLPDEAQATERAQRHLALLQELAEIGMDLARDLRRQAQQPDSPAGLDLSFNRIARAVRLTLALESRIAEDRAAEAARRLDETRRQIALRTHFQTLPRATVRRVVNDAIEIEAEETGNDERVEDLKERLDLRLDKLDLSEDRPVGPVIAALCKELGVTVDWTYFDDDPWALEELRTRPEGSPFANGKTEPIWPEWDDDDEDDPPLAADREISPQDHPTPE